MKFPELTHKVKLLIVAGIAAVAVVIVALAAISVSILRAQSTTPFARKFANVFPLPAAHVDGAFLMYRDVLARWDTVDTFIKNAPTSTADGQMAPRDVLRQQVYEQAIREIYIQQAAREDHFSLPETAVQNNLTQLIERASSTEAEMGQYLHDTYGWTVNDFRDRIVRPATLEEALAQRAAVAGTTVEQWRQQVKDALKSAKVSRYLKFAKPLPEDVIPTDTATSTQP